MVNGYGVIGSKISLRTKSLFFNRRSTLSTKVEGTSSKFLVAWKYLALTTAVVFLAYSVQKRGDLTKLLPTHHKVEITENLPSNPTDNYLVNNLERLSTQ